MPQNSPRTPGSLSAIARLRAFVEWQVKKSHQTIADLIYGVDTSRGVVDPVRDTSAPFAYDAATPWGSLRRIFRHLRLDFSRFTFIDMGCGKGRMVLAASTFPFKSVIGVEFAPSLCRAAESNLARCRFLRRRTASARIVECDAIEFVIPCTPCVFFFYNPFNFTLLETVITHIIASYYQYPREIYLIFVGMSTVFPQIILIPGMRLLHSSSIPFSISDNRSVHLFLVTGG